MCDRKGLQTNSTTSPVIFIPFLTKCYLPIQIPKFLTSLLFFFFLLSVPASAVEEMIPVT